MKDPEKYLKEQQLSAYDLSNLKCWEYFIEAIKQAQIDAYNEALGDAIKNAECGFDTHKIVDNKDVFGRVSATTLYDDDYKYSNNFDSLPSINVTEQSILKLRKVG